MDFLITFFNFTLAVHYYNNHTGFMTDLPIEDPDDVSIEDVVKFPDRGGTHNTLCMRGYWLAIRLALWLFGLLWMLSSISSIVASRSPLMY